MFKETFIVMATDRDAAIEKAEKSGGVKEYSAVTWEAAQNG
jgi:hypothetical protein